MSGSNIQKLYNFYEVFNDFNRIRILITINSNEKTIDEISEITNISQTIVTTQLEYLKTYKIVFEKQKEEQKIYKIKDKNIIRITNNLINYINN